MILAIFVQKILTFKVSTLCDLVSDINQLSYVDYDVIIAYLAHPSKINDWLQCRLSQCILKTYFIILFLVVVEKYSVIQTLTPRNGEFRDLPGRALRRTLF